MGLSLEVGILADLAENDPEGAKVWVGHFQSLDRYLRSIGQEPHAEPRSGEVWSADMFGYSGLHYLRRLAAHVDSGGGLPEPGDERSAADALVEAYGKTLGEPSPGLFARLRGKKRRFARGFDHLMFHSDAEGLYLPRELDEVLFPAATFGSPGAMVGSAACLLRELERLAELLEIPESLHAASEELCVAADSQGEGAAMWERYGVESHSCVALREGCRKALELGAALVFT